MDVIETYPWTGEQVPHPRRDKRRGQHIGCVTLDAQSGAPSIVCTWSDPYGGRCSDTFNLSEDGHTLIQVTDMEVHTSGRRTQFRQVWCACAGALLRFLAWLTAGATAWLAGQSTAEFMTISQVRRASSCDIPCQQSVYIIWSLFGPSWLPSLITSPEQTGHHVRNQPFGVFILSR